MTFEQERRAAEHHALVQEVIAAEIAKLGPNPRAADLSKAVATALRKLDPNRGLLTYETEENYEDL